MLSPILILFFIQQFGLAVPNHNIPTDSSTFQVTMERSRAFSILFSSFQCLDETDQATEEIREINRNFNPEHYIDEYSNKDGVERLLQLVQQIKEQPERLTEPFTFAAASIDELEIILNVIYPITDHWPLFFNTSTWLLGRVNGARLHWALAVIAGEKFTKSVVTPTAVEVFPQHYIHKMEIASVADIKATEYGGETHPLLYYLNDPRLNEYHYNWHIDNPILWTHWNYPVRDRKGELFLYMHHQLLSRYNAELVSNGLPYVTSLELQPDYVIPDPYYPNIVNINFKNFPIRYEGTKMKHYDDGTRLSNLRTWFERLDRGIEQGYFVKEDGTPEFIWFENNGTDLLGGMIANFTPTVNIEHYGTFHSSLHGFFTAPATEEGPSPGVIAHPETTLRDRVFFQLHQSVDDLYQKLKSRVGAYTALDLNYPDIQIVTVEIQTTPLSNVHNTPIPVLTTYFDWDAFDISTAARPCRGVGGSPAFVNVQTLRHHPFNYSLTIRSTLSTKAFGMVRIFILPEVGHQGRILTEDESQLNAIQLDLFPVELQPNQTNTIVRSSMSSSITRMPLPGIKALYNMTPPLARGLLGRDMKRSCGFPNNLLIPKGTEDGIGFKLFVMISNEPEIPEESILPHYPYCGMLNGLPYPDKRPMGFPLDRTRAGFASSVTDWEALYKNIKQTPIIIKHQRNIVG